MDARRRFIWLAVLNFVLAGALAAQPTINPPNGTPPGLQSSDNCVSPTITAGAAVTSGTSVGNALCLYINGTFSGATVPTVTWTNTVTNVSQQLSLSSYTPTQIKATVPIPLFSTLVTAPQPVTITVDLLGVTATATYTINPPLGAPSSGVILPAGTTGVAYAQPVASGGTGPYTVSLQNSSLYPPGLQAATGTDILSGTPTISGFYSFDLQIVDIWSNVLNLSEAMAIVDPQTVTSISATSIAAGSPGFTLTVNGSNFVAAEPSPGGSITGSTVSWSVGPVIAANPTLLPTTYVSPNQITAFIPGTLLTTPGAVTIAVVLPGGLPSNPTSFAVLPPVLSSISPSSMTARPTPVTLVATGANFTTNQTGTPQSTMLTINGIAVASTLGTNGLTTTQTFAQPGIYAVALQNPGGSVSNALNLTVLPAPTLTSLSPNFAIAGGPGFNLTVTGSNFTNTMAVLFNGTPLPTTFVSGTQLIGAVPPNLVGTAGLTAPVSVVTFDNYQTAALLFSTTNAPRIVTTSLPGATSGQAYDVFVVATGGKTPYAWSATGLPAGLSIDVRTGEIRGTPNTNSNFTVGVTVTDAIGVQASASFPVTVTVPAPPIRIDSTASLPDGVVGVPYNAFVGASGGTGTLTLSATGLPAGVAMNTGGFITGTPTAAGAFRVIVQATDSTGASATAGYTLLVRPAPLSVTAPAIDPIPLGSAVNIKFGGIGGVPPYSFNFRGTFPTGTDLDKSGSLTGTANATGTFTFTIFVIDAAGTQASRNFSVTVTTPTVSVNAKLPDGQVGVAYSGTAGASGGTPPYNVTVSGLPDGLAFSNGAVSGTPTAAGTFTVTVSATDAANGKISQNFTVTIAPAPLTVSTVSLGNGTVGSGFSGSVAASGGTPPFTWSFIGLPGGVTGSTGGVLSGSPTTPGTFTVTAKVTDAKGQTASKQFTVTIAVPALTLNATSLTTATVGTAVSSTFTATGGVPPYTWSASGLPAGLTLSTGGVLSGSPVGPGTGSFTVTVKDSAGTTASLTVRVAVLLPVAPAINFNGLPPTSNAATQSSLQIELGAAYPVDVAVVLSLTFAADSGPDDPTVQFAAGGRTITVVVPAGSTSAAASVPLQMGTVAGLATITARLSAASQDITPTPAPVRTVRVAPSAPAISKVTATAASGGFSVTVVGFATTRSITQALFTVNFVGGAAPATFTIPVETLFVGWYSNAASAAFGSQFTYTQNFNVTGGLGTIASVTVTLSNALGASGAVTATIQ